MTIHREGYKIILVTFLLTSSLAALFYYIAPCWLASTLNTFLLVVFILVLQFFRYPKRIVPNVAGTVICPADGKVVVIEEVEEHEFYKGEKRLQVSVFMSPLNVHANWFPMEGVVEYMKYHAGKYLVAWHPKSSTENERTTVVVKNGDKSILFRQIAGAMARRIVCYAKEGTSVKYGDEAGFIKFGSRVDVYLPLDANVEVKLGDKVQGGKTLLATL